MVILKGLYLNLADPRWRYSESRAGSSKLSVHVTYIFHIINHDTLFSSRIFYTFSSLCFKTIDDNIKIGLIALIHGA